MESEAIKTQLRNYIRERYNVAQNDAEFSDNVHLYDYGYVDSFGAVDLMAMLASKFSIKANESDLTTIPLNTIEQIADFVIKRRKGEV